MIKDWILEYKPKNEEQILNALREIMQEVALAALSRTAFFEKAGFYGGTALRIFYGLDRFSEDLDFSLLQADESFTLEPYFSALQTEFEALGMRVKIQEKQKQSAIESAFLKTETLWNELVLEDIVTQLGLKSNKVVKIKIEVDRNPPQRFKTEEKLLIRPFSFYVKCFTPPCLFAGKLHALLYRKWNNRVKGRDWYDFEWYIKKGIPLDVGHFFCRAKDSGDWKTEQFSAEQIIEAIQNKIDSVSFSSIKEDLVRFVPDDRSLSIWDATYFKDLVEKMKFENSFF
jgi:predicted nucleotidyltransferase component of viral defense system